MARRRYRRYRRKSARWAPNIQEVGNMVTCSPSTWSATEPIMANPTQVNTFVSQTYTVKNIEITFNIDSEGTNYNAQLIEGITAYIMFVPQGMTITNDYNLQHPEYIMAYKYIGSPTTELQYSGTGQPAGVVGQQYQPTRVRTRLSRKLQTGDSIILFLKGVNQTQDTITLRLSGLIRWWTKAN